MTFSAQYSRHALRRSMRRVALASLTGIGMAVSLWGCDGHGSNSTSRATNVLYVESNEPGANTLLAYHRSTDGSLTPLSGSPFDLRGQGLANPTEDFGPSDADQQIITNSDHSLLYAVNSGSNTIAVMNIKSDGTLTHITGSPFPSGGVNPISLALYNNRLYCANKNVASKSGSGTPSYTAFNVAATGALTQIPAATLTSSAGASAAQILASRVSKTMFTNDFFGPVASPPTGSLRSWQINADGSLTQAGSAQTVPVPVPAGTPAQFQALYAVTQGVQTHPTQHIFYACAPISSSICVYTYDDSGVLTFHSLAKTTGALSCWLLINQGATRMYVVSTGDNSVSTMDITNPLAPVEIQRLVMKDAGPTFPVLPIIANVASSTGSEESLDPSGQFLYVISHRNNPDTAYHGGNLLHILRVNSDGTLGEAGNSVNLNVSDNANVHGLLTF